jgi:hypothetical protein
VFSNVDTLTQVKLQELKYRTREMDPHVIIVQEVKPKNFTRELHLSEYNIDGYELLPLNISKESPGRGMIMYVKETVKYTPSDVNNVFQEGIFCELELKSKDRLLIGGIYRSPTSSEENFSHMCETIREVCASKYTHVLLMGDLNLPGIDWDSGVIQGGTGTINYKFVELLRDCYLHQHITEPTRGRWTDKPSTLDLLCSNEEGMVSDIIIDAPIGKSDHSVVSFRFNAYIMEKPRVKYRHHYDKADYDKMREHLNIDWDKEFALYPYDVDRQWTCFSEKLNRVIEDYVPTKRVTLNGGRSNRRHAVPLNRKTL